MLFVASWLLVKKLPGSQHKCFMDTLKSSLKTCQISMIQERLWSSMSGGRHPPSAIGTGVKHVAKLGAGRQKRQRKENELFHSSETFILCL